MKSVTVVDYGLGNLRSVLGAICKVGGEAVITADPEQIRKADRLILPGVGAFGDGMDKLRQRGLIEPMREACLQRGQPILGICLGFQLLGRSSPEFGDHDGLGWIDAEAVPLAPNDAALRVPHVGWNDLDITMPECPLFHDVSAQPLFYFVHSFKMVAGNRSLVAGTCDYGGGFDAAISQDNLFGTQFHPEKSQRDGLTVLQNFLTHT